MTDPLRFTPDDPRVRRLNARLVNEPPRGHYVLYWMQMYRRARDNAALAYALERANELHVPCLVYEALRPDHPHASDRLHAFVLQGSRDVAAALEAYGVAHVFFLPRTADEARGVLGKLAARACLVVSDDYPSFVGAMHNAAGAARVKCAYVVVDDCAVVPMALVGEPHASARTMRPRMSRALDAWLRPIHEPLPRVAPAPRLELPFDPVDLARADPLALAASCAIDHAVPPVLETPGGAREAERRLQRFVRGPLGSYAEDRNDPTRDATSGLSPYLHFGMISARRVALEARAWGEGASLEAFLEQLLVRRGLAFNFARTQPEHATYAALPPWARATLAEHAGDARSAEVTLADLERGRSPDPLWNAAMGELRARGTIQPYARMLWGKLPLGWMRRPEDAHAALVHLNDKWALDGRDPDGYANISWCFGLHDRPWPPHEVSGTIRRMTSASARRKLDFEDYVTRWTRDR